MFPKLSLLVTLAVILSGQAVTPAREEINALYPDLAVLYRDLHQNPELGFQEVQTAAKLAARLSALGYNVTTHVAGTGVVALLKNGTGPTVMLRTELDALPVQEKTGVTFASKVTAKNAEGQSVPVMHACGHDLHMAAWSGTARWMSEHRDRWRGTLMLVGQPAEEGSGGAAAMIKDGLFTRFPKPDFALSFHDDDTMPAGTIGFHPGVFRASSTTVNLVIHGRGGHGAMPHNTVDPIVMAAKTILALQTIVSRENNPLNPIVITVGSIRGGTGANVIPDEVTLELSVRAFDESVRKRVLAAIDRIAKAEALAAGAPREPSIAYRSGAEAVNNDPVLVRRLAVALQRTMGAEQVMEMPPKMTSEDFSAYGLAGVPSALLHVGAVSPSRLASMKLTGVPVPAPHSPEWLPDLEPTLKGAVLAEISALLELFGRP